MLTSGLVSLNVHEALTFDEPLVVHPDLFSPQASDGSFAGSASARQGIEHHRLQIAATASSEEKISGTSQKRLQVGDMVEIRVWDPLPRAPTSTTPSPPNTFRKHRSATPIPPPSPPISAQSSTSDPDKLNQATTTTKDALEAAAANLHTPTQSEGTRAESEGKDSMQYSESAAPSADVKDKGHGESGGHSKEGDMVSTGSSEERSHSIPEHTAVASPNALSPHNDDTLPTKTVITSGDLPPVFPRSRTNTADGAINIRSSTTPISKPPIAQRRATATLPDGYNQKPRPIQQFKSRHSRDLSDMTMDTVYTNDNTKTQTLDSAHQIVDLQLPAPSSDDEDETWTHLSNTHLLRLSFVMLVTEKSLTSLKGSARTQVSILRQVADLYELSSYDMVTIHKIEKDEREAVLQAVSADFVVVTIKDQFISRGDMHFFQKTLIGSWIYEGQRLHEPNRGIQSNAREIRHGDHLARSGIVTEDTKITYRSRSARIFWLVQVSAEMWDYASPYERNREEESICEIYFDRFISFVYELFTKWKEIEATHSLTMVFFSRTFLNTGPAFHESDKSRPNQKDVYGRRYEDHYRTVVENETRADWESLVRHIKEAFVSYPREVGWNLSTGDDGRRPSTASQGNVLEAINVTLNLLQYHFFDRDLQRTGNSIVLVSAGSGVFEVDEELASITYQRMMDHGIGSDMLSLGLPPLHIAPFFLYVSVYQSVDNDGVDASESYFEVPHWMHLSFLSYESDSTVPGGSRENVRKDGLKDHWNPAGLEIGANGFLLSRSIDKPFDPSSESSPLLRSAGSFSRRGNAAASPKKKRKPLTQERQLIAGRDFRDILEACRPRHGRLIPSALKTLLAMYQRTLKENIGNDESKNDAEEVSSIEEWGALELKEKGDGVMRLGRRTMAIGQDGREHPSPLLGPIPSAPRVDELDHPLVAEASSPSSSYTSVLGMSFDRPFLAHQSSPSVTGIQMQRAPSLEIEVPVLDDDGSEGGLSDRSVSSSGLDTAGDSSLEEVTRSSTRTKHDSDRLLENLKKIMRAHDLNAFAESSPKIGAITEPMHSRHSDKLNSSGHGQTGAPSQSSSLGVPSQQVRLPGGQDVSTGGIGAALSQYRPASTAPGLLRNDQDGPSAQLSRVLSTGRMTGTSPRRNQIYDMGSRGLSPLILPPVAHSTTDPPPDILRRDGGSFSGRSMLQRLVHPQEFSRQLGGESAGSSRQVDTSLARRNVSAIAGQRQEVIPDGQSAENRRLNKRGQALSSSPPSQAITIRKANREAAVSRRRTGAASRRKKAFNPFRQQDEDEVLAKKSHNRRRWSHVFPLGEVEFKRHAGPNWKSLSSPAILPLSIDYFPPQHEIDHNYTHGFHNVTLGEFENTLYSSSKDLFMEMVRQRITQDYQLVPPSHVNASNYSRESLRDGLANGGRSLGRSDDNPETIRKFLSMGHQLQVLTYDASSDIIEVTRHIAKSAQENAAGNSFKYYYLGYCQETGKYTKVVQTFNKYADQYNWNKVDRIICGDEDREMRDGMRFRRIMFALIPDHFDNVAAEQGYIAKFLRLLEYLNKLREKEESESALNIKIVCSEDKDKQRDQLFSTPGIDRNSMKKFYVQLRKSKRDTYEWMEVAVDSTFDTSWSYRIMFNWLVASSGKVDTQIQLLQRRCTQFGLTLVPAAQTSVSRTVYLNPFKAPAIFTVRDKNKVSLLNPVLVKIDFLHDGVFYTDARSVTECIEKGDEFDFGKRWSRPPAGRQFIHRSGTLFVRILTDLNGLAILVVFGNNRYIARDESLRAKADAAFRDLSHAIASLVKEESNDKLASADSGRKTAASPSAMDRS